MVELSIQQKVLEFVKQNPEYQGKSTDLVLSVMLINGELSQSDIDRLNSKKEKFSVFGFGYDSASVSEINYLEESYFLKAFNESAPISTTPITKEQEEILNFVKERCNQAQKDFDKQMLEDTWAGDLADAISKIWGSENTAKKVRKDLSKARSDIRSLELAAKTSNDAFKSEFKRIYGVEYNPKNINNYKQLEYLYGNALTAKTIEESFNETFYKLLNRPLGEESKIIGTNSAGIAMTTTISKEEVYNREFNKLAEMLGEGSEDYLKELIKQSQEEALAVGVIAIKPLSLEFKWRVLKKVVKDYSDMFAQQTINACNGKSFEGLQAEYQNAYKSAFGEKNDILKRVNDYNISQQKGAGYVKAGVLSAAMIAISVATMGTGTAVAGGVTASLLKSAGTVAGLTAVIEGTDKFTSGAALKSLREDGVLEYLKTASSMTDWKNVAVATVSSGAMVLVMGGVSYQVSNLTRIAGQKLGMSAINTAYAAAGTTTASNIAVGMGTEYLMTGEISVEGTIFNVTLAVIGGVTQIVKINQATQASAKVDIQAKRMQMESSLKELGFNSGDDINTDILKQRYKKLAIEFHSDRTGDDGTKMALINGAYEYLTTKCNISELQAYLQSGLVKPEIQALKPKIQQSPLSLTADPVERPVTRNVPQVADPQPFASFEYRTYSAKNVQEYLSDVLPIEKSRHAKRMAIYGTDSNAEPRVVTKSQIEAIDAIQFEMGEYFSVQEKLRTGQSLNKAEQNFYDKILEAITPTESERTLWRSISVYDGLLEEVQSGVIAAKGFSSTASQYDDFFDFWKSTDTQQVEDGFIITEGYMLKITVPEGTPILDCNAKYTPLLGKTRYTRFPGEVVLPEGKYVVKSIDTDLHVIEVGFEIEPQHSAEPNPNDIQTPANKDFVNNQSKFPNKDVVILKKSFDGVDNVANPQDVNEAQIMHDDGALNTLQISSKIQIKVEKTLNKFLKKYKFAFSEFDKESLLANFDYENAELHLKNLKILLKADSNRIDSIIKNGYFSSKEGAEALEYVLKTYSTKKRDRGLISEVDLYLSFADVESLNNAIKREILAVEGWEFLSKLSDDAYSRWQTSKYKDSLYYISSNDKINEFFLTVKYSAARIDQFKLLELSILENSGQNLEGIDEVINFYSKIAKTSEYGFRDLCEVLSQPDRMEGYRKAFAYAESKGLTDSKIVIVKDIDKADLYSLSNSPDIESLSNNKSWNTLFFDKNGNLIRQECGHSYNSFVSEMINTSAGTREYKASYPQENSGRNYLFRSDKRVFDTDGKLMFTETYRQSESVANKYEVYREFPNGKTSKVGLAEISENGDIVVEKNYVSDNGVETSYIYVESLDGSRLTYNKIVDKNGQVLFEHRYKYKVINDSHVVTTENGIEYDIQIGTNKVLVKTSDGREVKVSFGNKGEDELGVISKEMLETVKRIPGSMYFEMDSYGLKKIGLEIDGVNKNGAHFCRVKSLVSLSESQKDNEFALLHELAHMVQRSKTVAKNPEIIDTFLKERQMLMFSGSSHELKSMDYLINVDSSGATASLEEMASDIVAYLYSTNKASNIELRGQYMQQYFPETFAKVAKYFLNPSEYSSVQLNEAEANNGVRNSDNVVSSKMMLFSEKPSVKFSIMDRLKLSLNFKGRQLKEDYMTTTLSYLDNSDKVLAEYFIDRALIAGIDIKTFRYKIWDYIKIANKTNNPKDIMDTLIDFYSRFKSDKPNEFKRWLAICDNYLFAVEGDAISTNVGLSFMKAINENNITSSQIKMIITQGKPNANIQSWEGLHRQINFTASDWALLVRILPTLKDLSANKLGEIDFVNLIKVAQNQKYFNALTVNKKLNLVANVDKIPVDIQKRLGELGFDVQKLKTRLLENTRITGYEVNANPVKQKAFFKEVINNNSEAEMVIRSDDFNKFLLTHKNRGLPLKYSRIQFTKDLKSLLTQLPDDEQNKVLQLLNISLTDSSFEGFVKLAPLELNNFSSKSYNIIKQINNCLDSFGKNNEILCDNPKIKSLLDSIIQGFPEFLSIVGKQDAIHNNKLDIHILETLFNALNHPNYNQLNNSDKTALKLAILMHDIGKVEGINGNHSDQSAIYANNVLSKFNLSQNTKENVIELIRFHHFPTENYNFPINIGVKHIANIMAECDYKARFGENTKIESAVTYPKEGYQHSNYRTDHAIKTPEETYITHRRKLSNGKIAEVKIADMRNSNGHELAADYGWTASQKQLKDLVVFSHNCSGVENVKSLLEAYQDPLHDFELSAHVSPFTDIWNLYENHGNGVRFSLLLSAPDHHIGIVSNENLISGRKKDRTTFELNTEEQNPQYLSTFRNNETTVLRPKIERIVVLDNISSDKLPDGLIELSEKYKVPIIIYGNENKKWN